MYNPIDKPITEPGSEPGSRPNRVMGFMEGPDYPPRKKKDWFLLGLSGEYRGARISLSSDENVVIGSDPLQSNLVLSDKTVAPAQCRISQGIFDDSYFVEAVNSPNVYDANGEPMKIGETNSVKPGEPFWVGLKNAFTIKE